MFNHEELKVFLRGKIVPFGEANLSIANTSFLYGLGVFSGMRAHYNKDVDKLFIFRPADHFKRFHSACKLMRYRNFLSDYTCEKFISVIVELIRANSIKEDVYIRITNFTDENKITPRLGEYGDSLCSFLYPLGDYVPTHGMRCRVSSWTRVEDNSIPARAKINGAYVNTALAKVEAIHDGYDEAIFLDRAGNVVEGSAENIFFVIDGRLITPPVTDNILEGITRRTVIKLASDLGIKVLERSVDRSELYKADEIFLTGTGAKVSPVTSVDDIAVGDGQVGPISLQLQTLYNRVVRGEDPRYTCWLVDAYDYESCLNLP